MAPKFSAPVIFAVLVMFLLSTLLGAVVVGATTAGSAAGPAVASGANSDSTGSVGAVQLTQAEQAVEAGEGPGMGVPMRCNVIVGATSGSCAAVGSANPGVSPLSSKSAAPNPPPTERARA